MFLFAWLALAGLSWAAVAPPRQGIEQNVGQQNPDVLFVYGDQAFFPGRVQLTGVAKLSVAFSGSNAAARPEGRDRLAFPLHLYRGADAHQWKENVPHFATIRYQQIYPGIDAEWNTGFRRPMLRLLVAPGADPQQIQLQLRQMGQALNWFASLNRIFVASPSFYSIENLVAYQPSGSDRMPVSASFLQVDADSFRPSVGAYDSKLPLVIEMGQGFETNAFANSVKFASNGTAFFSGNTANYQSGALRSFLSAVSPAGEPVYLSVFDGIGVTAIAPGPEGTAAVVGDGCCWWEAPPVPAGAPVTTYRDDHLDAWIAKFDALGRLRAATFLGDRLTAFAADSAGDLYLASGNSVAKWKPGSPSYTFVSPIRGVAALAPLPAGGVAFSAPNTTSGRTTPAAVQASSTGPWDLYVGKLDSATGALRMATYVPIIGRQSQEIGPSSVLSVAPDGAVWIASEITFNGFFGYGIAHTLVAVSTDGSRKLFSESLKAAPFVAFDSQGSVFVAISTTWPNLPTSLDAAYRAKCMDQNVHLQILTASGALRSATYLPIPGWIISFDDPTSLRTSSAGSSTDVERYDVRQFAPKGISCAINTASREPLPLAITPGTLITLVGHQMGPLDQFNAPLGGTALQLAGVQVTLNGTPVPLVSVQQGLLTVYIPASTPLEPGKLEVWLSGTRVGSLSLYFEQVPNFGLFTADGSGRGPVASLNQDGTVNSARNPAKAGTIVSFFGTGQLPAVSPIFLFGSPAAQAVYDGPAPGLTPGVRQVNVLLPASMPPSNLTDGSFHVRVGSASNTRLATTIFVTP